MKKYMFVKTLKKISLTLTFILAASPMLVFAQNSMYHYQDPEGRFEISFPKKWIRVTDDPTITGYQDAKNYCYAGIQASSLGEEITKEDLVFFYSTLEEKMKTENLLKENERILDSSVNKEVGATFGMMGVFMKSKLINNNPQNFRTIFYFFVKNDSIYVLGVLINENQKEICRQQIKDIMSTFKIH